MRGGPDTLAPVSVVPEHGSGYPGRPGLLGFHPTGRDWSPRFTPDSHTLEGDTLTVRAVDRVADLVLDVWFELDWAFTVRAQVTNEGSRPYLLSGLTVTLPLPQHADELSAFTGRWARELHPVRVPWNDGRVHE